MATLPAIRCPDCDEWMTSREFEAGASGGAPRATDYKSCLRWCEKCGTAVSNACTGDLSKLTVIRLDPFRGMEEWLRDDWEETMDQALNVQSRGRKRARFGFSTSEDHLTWTVFRFLQRERILGETMHRAGIVHETAEWREPTLLFWGVPSPPGDPAGAILREQIEQVLRGIPEHPNSLSEPDLILDFHESGLVAIEVKLKGGNITKPRHPSTWASYVRETTAFRHPDRVPRCEMYELTRYWRIGCDLVGERPFTLVNLGPRRLFSGRKGQALEQFRSCLNESATRHFRTLTWPDLLSVVDGKPKWLRSYLKSRQVAM